MTSVYEHHEKAFSHVSAFCITQKGKRIGTIAFKFPKDGAGRLTCFFHIFGLEMARGFASGYGYDKKSAAAWSALKSTKIEDGANPEDVKNLEKMRAQKNFDSAGFDQALREAGFDVWQAV